MTRPIPDESASSGHDVDKVDAPLPERRGGCSTLLVSVAILLGLVALLTSGARWWLSTLESRTQAVSQFIATQTHSNVGIAALSGRMDRLDPTLQLSELNLFRPNVMDATPLLSIGSVDVRLDLLSSLRHLSPVFDRAIAKDVVVHIYQRENGSWGWPGPPRPPEALEPEGQMGLSDIEQGLAMLARQRVRLEDVRLALHGNNDTLNLNASDLLLSGGGGRAHLEGQLRVGESPQAGISAVLEVLPGDRGLADYSAQLQVELDAGALATVGRLLGERNSLMLSGADGNATLWARWREARLEDARLRLDLNRLDLDHQGTPLTLKDIHARGQWLRDLEGGNHWQAWLNQLSVGSPLLDASSAQGGFPSRAGSRSLASSPSRNGTAETHDDVTIADGATARTQTTAAADLPQRISLSGDLADGSVNLVTSGFDLAHVARWRHVLALGELGDALESLAPRGQATGLSFSLSGLGHDAPMSMAMALGLQDAQVDSWEGAPGLGPLSAWITAESTDEGGVDASVAFSGSQGMRFAFPEIFGAPWTLSSATGVVDIQVNDTGTHVSGRDLDIAREGATVTGSFGLQIPEGAADRFQLDLDMQNVDARSIPLARWLPLKVLDPSLSEWLTRDVAGRVSEGSLHLEQVWDDDNGEDGYGPGDTLDLVLDIEDGRLGYAAGWPALEGVAGRLALHDNDLTAKVDAGYSQPVGTLGEGARLSMSSADIGLADDTLKVTGGITGSVEALFDLLSHAPLDETSELLSEWQGSGALVGNLDVQVPLENVDNTRLTVDGKVGIGRKARLSFPGPGIAVNGIQGPLSFVHKPTRPEGQREQLTGKLSGQLFGSAVSAVLNIGQPDAPQEGAIQFTGQAPLAPVLDWLGAPDTLIGDADQKTQSSLNGGDSPRAVGGEFNYQARLMLPDSGATLSLASDLKGVAINLPAPFGKASEAAAPLTVDLGLVNGGGDVSVVDRARARWQGGNVRDDGSEVPITGQLWLERWPSGPQWPVHDGWDITWRTPTLVPEQWKPWFGSLAGENSSQGRDSQNSLSALQSVHVATDCLVIQDQCTGAMTMEASPRQSSARKSLGMAVSLEGQLATGNIVWQPDADQPLQLDLATLNLDALWPKDAQQESVSALSDFIDAVETGIEPTPYPSELARLPSGRLTLANLAWRDQQIGPISAEWQATQQQLMVSPLSLMLGDITVDGSITWEDAVTNSLTRARLSADGSHLGDLLTRLSQPRAVESERARAEAKLAWPGGPQDFALSRSSGQVEVKLDNGRFMNLGSTSARLLGLVNVDNLLRRLALDFSDVTDKGTAFDEVRGAATLYDGRLETDGPLRIEAPSTTVTLDGQVDLLRGTLDQRMAITVPVSQNLPLAAVLVGAPVVGGALFVADKIFGRFIDKVTQIHYRVSGPWGDPNITLESAE